MNVTALQPKGRPETQVPELRFSEVRDVKEHKSAHFFFSQCNSWAPSRSCPVVLGRDGGKEAQRESRHKLNNTEIIIDTAIYVSAKRSVWTQALHFCQYTADWLCQCSDELMFGDINQNHNLSLNAEVCDHNTYFKLVHLTMSSATLFCSGTTACCFVDPKLISCFLPTSVCNITSWPERPPGTKAGVL